MIAFLNLQPRVTSVQSLYLTSFFIPLFLRLPFARCSTSFKSIKIHIRKRISLCFLCICRLQKVGSPDLLTKLYFVWALIYIKRNTVVHQFLLFLSFYQRKLSSPIASLKPLLLFHWTVPPFLDFSIAYKFRLCNWHFIKRKTVVFV